MSGMCFCAECEAYPVGTYCAAATCPGRKARYRNTDNASTAPVSQGAGHSPTMAQPHIARIKHELAAIEREAS